MTHHHNDDECFTNEEGICTVCGVAHGTPCVTCGKRGFHDKSCHESEEFRLATKFPIGARVRIIGSDIEEYIGFTGVVRDYDFSDDVPLISVLFDAPMINVKSPNGTGPATRDGFYEEELVLCNERAHISRAEPTPLTLAEAERTTWAAYAAALDASNAAFDVLCRARDTYINALRAAMATENDDARIGPGGSREMP